MGEETKNKSRHFCELKIRCDRVGTKNISMEKLVGKDRLMISKQ